jgi:hypothetical protein
MTAEQFGAYMEKRLTLYDEVELLDREASELRLRVNGADVAADLGNFFIAYKADPAQIDVVVQTFARTLLGISLIAISTIMLSWPPRLPNPQADRDAGRGARAQASHASVSRIPGRTDDRLCDR